MPRRLYALLFHPEVAHTDHGPDILRNFAFDICGCTGDWTMASFVQEATERIRAQVGDGRVVCGLSGGVDSTVAALLMHKAIGDRLTCIFVDNGVMRLDEADADPQALRAAEAAAGLRRRVGAVPRSAGRRHRPGAEAQDHRRRVHRRVRDAKRAKLGSFDFLAQGTLYPDVIESVSVIGPSHVIKSHHNVGGLPERMRFKLVEPLRQLFKDEVRAGRQGAGPRRRVRLAAAVPGPGSGGADPRRGHAVAARTWSAARTQSSPRK